MLVVSLGTVHCGCKSCVSKKSGMAQGNKHIVAAVAGQALYGPFILCVTQMGLENASMDSVLITSVTVH